MKFWFYLGGWGAQRDDSEDVQRLRCGLFLDGCEAVASEVKYSKLWNNALHICNAKENCFDMIKPHTPGMVQHMCPCSVLYPNIYNRLQARYTQRMCRWSVLYPHGPAATEGVMGVRRQARDVPDANHCTACTIISYMQQSNAVYGTLYTAV